MEIARTGRIVDRAGTVSVVIEDVGTRGDHDFQRAVLAQEIRRHTSRWYGRQLAGPADNLGEMLRAPVWEIVEVDEVMTI